MRVMHCGLWQRATTVYSLFPWPNWSDLKRVVVMILECPHCEKTTYSWYGITPDNRSTPVIQIHPKEFDTEWRSRISENRIPDSDVQRQRLMVSQYSRSVARPADSVGRYLRQIK